jgi:hypothetical protein
VSEICLIRKVCETNGCHIPYAMVNNHHYLTLITVKEAIVHVVNRKEKHRNDKHPNSLILILACILLVLIMFLVLITQSR